VLKSGKIVDFFLQFETSLRLKKKYEVLIRLEIILKQIGNPPKVKRGGGRLLFGKSRVGERPEDLKWSCYLLYLKDTIPPPLVVV